MNTSQVLKSKHLPPLPNGRRVKVTVNQPELWKVKCTRPGVNPQSKTFEVVATSKSQATERAIHLFRGEMRVKSNVAVVAKATKMEPVVGKVVPSPVPAKFKKVDQSKGVTNGRYQK